MANLAELEETEVIDVYEESDEEDDEEDPAYSLLYEVMVLLGYCSEQVAVSNRDQVAMSKMADRIQEFLMEVDVIEG